MLYLHIVSQTKVSSHLFVHLLPVFGVLIQPLNQVLVENHDVSLQSIIKQVSEFKFVFKLVSISVIDQMDVNSLSIFPELFPD